MTLGAMQLLKHCGRWTNPTKEPLSSPVLMYICTQTRHVNIQCTLYVLTVFIVCVINNFPPTKQGGGVWVWATLNNLQKLTDPYVLLFQSINLLY